MFSNTIGMVNQCERNVKKLKDLVKFGKTPEAKANINQVIELYDDGRIMRFDTAYDMIIDFTKGKASTNKALKKLADQQLNFTVKGKLKDPKIYKHKMEMKRIHKQEAKEDKLKKYFVKGMIYTTTTWKKPKKQSISRQISNCWNCIR